TRSWPRAVPTCACSRARTSGIRTGPGTPPTSWAGRCPGPDNTPRSTVTGPASATPEPRASAKKDASMSVTYASYLKIDELLKLQQPLSDGPEHDETLFIVIHQVYELWFKELLHELDFLAAEFRRGEVARAQHTLKRVLTILKVLVHQIDVLETM